MTELFTLPQLVAARTDRARQRAGALFGKLTDTVIELEPEVVLANRALSAHRAIDPLADPRVRLYENDARSALLLSGLRFDAIAPLGARHDHRLDRLAAMRVLGADDASLLDRRVLVHERFDFGGPHLVA